ncbi:DegT/DnrJ/EryC1/StrS family aminotransferase [Mucilaginibacter sp. JRF]|uniref:DegT/DnrJ/EryC1/StrS family aminotransferase n=1 Tax=Mucilaginibacter sp. JRF TaxID=2780088 RepID=UPI001881E062|nr:DegT/DnrJ/EryC1/StrS family aminotransferase [Mucilaginibacter sp. JRF]MBE9585142.1 DegT/DnrJ/EryC1/StrS family aminotransferase [Mucilaginibacter sp. JRF]
MIKYEDLLKVNEPFTQELGNAFNDVIASGWYIMGKQLELFEQNFAAWNNAAYCTGVANGLDALTLALKVFDLEAGSEVIVPSNTYIATILAIMNNGLVPVLVEPDINTYNIDPVRVEQAITPKTKALMIVHLYGKCCDMDALMPIKTKYNLLLIEDCAQAHGASLKGKMAGTYGEFGAFSFYPTKNLGALGDAGALLTNDEQLNSSIRRVRNYGSDTKYYNDVVGVNSRLDEMQAAFLNIKLKHLHSINAKKAELAALYHQYLKDDFIKPLATAQNEVHVYHIYNIRHPKREALKAYLLKHEIGTEIHYPVPPHQQKALADLFTGQQYPIAEEIHATTLSLPCSYAHTKDEVMRVIEVMNRF